MLIQCDQRPLSERLICPPPGMGIQQRESPRNAMRRIHRPAVLRGLMSGAKYAKAVLAAGPLLFYRLNETSGTSYADLTGNGRTGTGSGTITQGTGPLLRGNVGSVTFAGAGKIATTDPYGGAGGTNWLVGEVCFQVSTLGITNYMLGRGSPSSNFHLYVRVDTNNSVSLGVVNSSGGAPVVSSPAGSVAANTPYHVAWEAKPGVGANLYLNSVLYTAAFGGTNWRVSTNNDLTIGECVDPSGKFSGAVSDLAWYSSALGQALVNEHYASAVAA